MDVNAFAALAEPRRQEIVSMLAERGELSASEISQKFKISAPAVSQHLKVLKNNNLVLVKKDAQRRLYSLNPDGLQEMTEFLQKVRAKWEARFDRLDQYLKKLQQEKKNK